MSLLCHFIGLHIDRQRMWEEESYFAISISLLPKMAASPSFPDAFGMRERTPQATSQHFLSSYHLYTAWWWVSQEIQSCSSAAVTSSTTLALWQQQQNGAALFVDFHFVKASHTSSSRCRGQTRYAGTQSSLPHGSFAGQKRRLQNDMVVTKFETFYSLGRHWISLERVLFQLKARMKIVYIDHSILVAHGPRRNQKCKKHKQTENNWKYQRLIILLISWKRKYTILLNKILSLNLRTDMKSTIVRK